MSARASIQTTFQVTPERFDHLYHRSRQSTDTLALVSEVFLKKKPVQAVADAHAVHRAHIYDSLHRFIDYEARTGEMTEEAFNLAADYWKNNGKELHAEACRLVLVEGWSIMRAAEHLSMPLTKLQDLVRRLRLRYKRLTTHGTTRRAKLLKPEPQRFALTNESLKAFVDNVYTRPLGARTVERARLWHVEGCTLHQIALLDDGLVSDVRTSLECFERYYSIFRRYADMPRDEVFSKRVAEACEACELTPRATEAVTLLLMGKNRAGRLLCTLPLKDLQHVSGIGLKMRRVRQFTQQVIAWLDEHYPPEPAVSSEG